MLTGLSIRDVVLIDRLELSFGAGLTVLTGETGAGKSILLDSLGLALGARADGGLVRAGAAQASVSAVFAPAAGHPAHALLVEQGIEAEDQIVLRRVLGADGRSRAFVNDQPVGVALLRRLGELLIELQGQHEQMGLADPARQAVLLDAYGVPPALARAVEAAWHGWRAAADAHRAARAAVEAADREEEYLRHAVAELEKLSPEPAEEDRLAAERTALQHADRHAQALAAALTELAPRDRRGPGPAAALRSAARALDRLGNAMPQVGAVAEAIGRAEEALAEAETMLSRLVVDAEADPRRLEQTEERLFDLRAAARKHAVPAASLPELLVELRARLVALDTASADLAARAAAEVTARAEYLRVAEALSAARQAASGRLARAVAKELAPLRLDKARFVAEVARLPEAGWSARGADQVRFLIAANPGQEPGPLARVASGGELSRLMLALKVVLVRGSTVPSLIFDEVDSGIGGATAAAVGERLARVAEAVQVLVVTHSPQVAARGTAHLLVAKQVQRGAAETRVVALDLAARREEIARMLAGEAITDAARAAAAELLG